VLREKFTSSTVSILAGGKLIQNSTYIFSIGGISPFPLITTKIPVLTDSFRKITRVIREKLETTLTKLKAPVSDDLHIDQTERTA